MGEKEIVINPNAPDDHWVSPSGSDCWCTVGQLKNLVAGRCSLSNDIARLTANVTSGSTSVADQQSKTMMKFNSEDFIFAIREMYKEWRQLMEEKEGVKTSLPDFEQAIDHVARHGLDPIEEEV